MNTENHICRAPEWNGSAWHGCGAQAAIEIIVRPWDLTEPDRLTFVCVEHALDVITDIAVGVLPVGIVAMMPTEEVAS